MRAGASPGHAASHHRSYTNEYFRFSNDDGGETDIPADGPLCYCRGTMILTGQGEMPVQDLRIGDRLATASGGLRPLRWVGTRSYSLVFARGNRAELPVRIAQGALGKNLPHRDLFVSPLHAMFIDDMLIPARALLNGTSIMQLEHVELIDYFHVELATHDILLAEGALSESYVEDGNRFMFHNASAYDRLYPDAPEPPAKYCAPRVEDGPELERIRRRIARQAS